MDSVEYIGMDVHKDTISIAVLNSSGKLVMECIIETKASTILQFIQGLSGSLHVTFEEGTWAAWLYDLLKPHVTELVVCNPRRNALLKEGSKSDRIDARKLSELLRSNLLRPVYHGEHGVRTLKELARSYLTISKDLGRVMSRLKAIYRSWGIPCTGKQVYAPRYRSEWLGKIAEGGVRRRAEFYYQQFDALRLLRQEVRRDRSVSRSSETQRDEIVTRDSIHRPDPGGCYHRVPSDPASLSYQAAVMDLHWVWNRNAQQCRSPLCRRTAAAREEADLDSGTESQS
jgi:hypothetical protein